MWFRVFGTNDVQPRPAGLLEHLHGLGVKAAGHFHGDDRGWFRADFVLDDENESIRLERFLSKEDDLRDDLNTWAAWLESVPDNPHPARLMQHMIATTQLFTLERPQDLIDDDAVAALCVGICRFLARETAGVYQIDTQGFFAADGTLLVPEERANQS